MQYIERNVKFFQVWALTSDLALKSTLCAVNNQGRTNFFITAPTTPKRAEPSHRTGRRAVEDPFIVRDGLNDEELLERRQNNSTKRIVTVDLPSKMNWKELFRHVFLGTSLNSNEAGLSVESREVCPKLEELLARILDRIRIGMEEGKLAINTL